MARKDRKQLTPVETIIMDAVWDLTEATVRNVKDHLEPTRPMAYNTVLTMLRILRDKGFLQTRRDGRSDVYRPVVTREQAAGRSISDVLERFFSGSAPALVSQLLESEHVSEDEIRAIRREVDRKLRATNR
ncbi:MAG: BlaI/MecI/CopY family transcriptional regulator [Phycisphaerae bacterium]|nr:BlaI/MecI/CopY family transcriptional regulator [Phycisphaerae bacterium]